MTEHPKFYDAHLADYRKVAYIHSKEQYQEMYRKSIDQPEAFWAEQAEKYLSWDKKWDFVLDYDFKEAKIQWFGNAKLNASYNCLDRHLDTIKDKIAFYWEGDRPEDAETYTYGDVYERVNRFAAVLKSRGLQKGDRVIIYLPMIIELPVALLACARIGAIHSVVFGGFSAEAIANRITDSNAKLVITADGGYRGGKPVSLKGNVDAALENCPNVETVVVVNRTGADIKLNPNKEIWWH
ncbi:MAG: AMP-binding protein, partial [Desulfobacterales bacterium]